MDCRIAGALGARRKIACALHEIKQTLYMSPKIQAIIAGVTSGVAGYMAYFIALPPSLQTGMMGQVISILPAQYQTAAAGVSRTLQLFLGFWATYKLAHSGPQTPPQSAEDKAQSTTIKP